MNDMEVEEISKKTNMSIELIKILVKMYSDYKIENIEKEIMKCYGKSKF